MADRDRRIVFVVFLLLTWRDTTNWQGLFDALDCCSVFGVLVLASLVMIGGLVFWQSLLLVAGASILMLQTSPRMVDLPTF